MASQRRSPSAFERAFAEARARGDKTFEFTTAGGKKGTYGTRLKGEDTAKYERFLSSRTTPKDVSPMTDTQKAANLVEEMAREEKMEKDKMFEAQGSFKSGGKIGRGCGAAMRGGGAVMRKGRK
jgi:hypothetical protein